MTALYRRQADPLIEPVLEVMILNWMLPNKQSNKSLHTKCGCRGKTFQTCRGNDGNVMSYDKSSPTSISALQVHAGKQMEINYPHASLLFSHEQALLLLFHILSITDKMTWQRPVAGMSSPVLPMWNNKRGAICRLRWQQWLYLWPKAQRNNILEGAMSHRLMQGVSIMLVVRCGSSLWPRVLRGVPVNTSSVRRGGGQPECSSCTWGWIAYRGMMVRGVGARGGVELGSDQGRGGSLKKIIDR